MATSIDLSIDDLLLLQENQYQMSNFVLTNIKPIGAERKIGQSTKIKSSSHENNHAFETPTIMSIDDHFHFSPCDEYDFSTYPSFVNSTAHLSRSQLSTSVIQQKSISTRMPTGSMNAEILINHSQDVSGPTLTYHPVSRFYPPQYYARNSFLNPPMFSAPFRCHRERFQVNSIGRPILRPTNHHFKLRR